MNIKNSAMLEVYLVRTHLHKFDISDAKVFSQSVYFNVVHNYTHSSSYANASLPLRRSLSCSALASMDRV